jgi:hypothetical protein
MSHNYLPAPVADLIEQVKKERNPGLRATLISRLVFIRDKCNEIIKRYS